ncbi:four-helix bundle copper-binding protein [Niallia sp. JL1B1071]|uniref:four-helix bundle copper-binding protein n=1 Tax=Niallia tiangongensis TaxID=3237105 RepID=UPI0037DCB02A
MLIEKEQLLIKSLQECMIVCNHCLNECLAVENVTPMIDCIHTNRECIQFCSYLEQAIIRKSPYAKEFAEICLSVCQDCARECEKHDHRHCQYCADICRECANACKTFLEA